MGAMKGVILGINPQAVLVDLSHDLAPQDIRAGALVLAAVAPYCPPGDIHLAVVDPGVDLHRLGPTITDPVALPWPAPVFAPEVVRVESIFVDRFGNLIGNLKGAAF